MSICPSVYGVSWSGPGGVLWFDPVVSVTTGPENIHYYVLHFHISLKKMVSVCFDCDVTFLPDDLPESLNVIPHFIREAIQIWFKSLLML